MRLGYVAALLAAAAAAGCSSSDAPSGEACNEVEIQRFKELVVIEPGVLGDPRSVTR